MEQKIKKIGVLTSGGDAPGMNAAIRAVVRAGIHYGLEVYGIEDGFLGLVKGDKYIKPMCRGSVTDIITRGGTTLGTARLKEFQEIPMTQKGIDNLKALGIDALVTIGGDGTFYAAERMSRLGMPCVSIPGTIDNDIASTDYTIGFDTAVNTAVEAIDKLRDTSNSHQRCTIVEVMGRYCGDIALAVAVATGAEIVVTSKETFDIQKILEEAKTCKELNKRHAIFIISENITDVHALAKQVEEYSGFSSRATVLSHIQRGGSPSAKDRILASQFGLLAVEALINGKSNITLGFIDNKFVEIPIKEALQMKRNKFLRFEEIMHILS